MTLKKEQIELTMNYLHNLLPIAEQRMGSNSKMMNSLTKIEQNLGILLQQAQPKKIFQKKILLTSEGYQTLKRETENLKKSLTEKKGATVYQYIEKPTKKLLIQLEIIIKNIPF